ncbi:MAG: hypothetical protein WA173_02205 [Pseudomonas sp.]|uniref:hypothetical protein n=1 Tax=Pseudomonas sp. TaxID=306 RepID=UPI003BB59A6B
MHGVFDLRRLKFKQLVKGTFGRGAVVTGQRRLAEHGPGFAILRLMAQQAITAIAGTGVIALFETEAQLPPKKLH